MTDLLESIRREVERADFQQMICAMMAEKLARDLDEAWIDSMVRSSLRMEFMGSALGLLDKSRKLKMLAAIRRLRV